MPEPVQCARGARCAVPTLVVEQGDSYRVGGEVETDGRAFCDTCVRQLVYLLGGLKWDVAELTTLMVPSMQVKLSDPDAPAAPRVKKAAPLPFDGNAEALRALIDHEVTCWAESTADAAGVDWSSAWAAQSRIGARVQAGADLLAHRIDHFLGLPPVRHPARSTGEHPTDGHDPDTVTYDGLDYWIERDGTDAALAMWRLQHHVESLVGRTPSDRLPMPCPDCRTQTLFREHARSVTQVFTGTRRKGAAGRVVCRSCWRVMTDAEYEASENLVERIFGVRA